MTSGIEVPRDLGDGLLLRWSRPADTNGIKALTSNVFRDTEDEPPSAMMNYYAGDLMRGDHPLMSSQDFALVEDAETGRIVACSCLLRQTWSMGGVQFPVGRPELVASNPAYRRRGLIRAIFGAIHARSAARGDLVQGITGIPYFYRQFGYEYALELGGGRTAYLTDVPSPAANTTEAYRLRPAGATDAPIVSAIYNAACRRSWVSTALSEDHWRAKIVAPAQSDADWQVLMIVDEGGTACGYAVVAPIRFNKNIVVRQLETAPGTGMGRVALPVLHALRDLAPTIRTAKPLDPPTGIAFALGSAHPWYDALSEQMLPRRWPPYAWYVRVADVPRFVMHIRASLERQLAQSALAGYSGDLRLDFYRGGIRLVFQDGKLTQVEHWQPDAWAPRDYAAFPPLVFLQLIFGYRSLDELRAAFPDSWCDEHVEPLLQALFPAHRSQVLPLD